MTYPLPADVGLANDNLRVYAFAQQVLGLVAESAMELLVDLPAKQYCTGGEAVYDCEQVAVTCTSMTTGMPGQDPAASVAGVPMSVPCDPVWSLSMEAAIVRCGPQIQRSGAVLADDLNASFQSVSADASVLLLAIDKLASSNLMGPVIATVTFVHPSGDMVPTVAYITAALP